MKDCIFCKIINGDIPSKTVYEDDIVKVFLDINPIHNGHMLIVPKQHREDFIELKDEELIYIKNIAKKMMELVFDKLDDNGMKLVANYGTFQEVKHFHLHLVPANTDRKDEIIDTDIILDKLTK